MCLYLSFVLKLSKDNIMTDFRLHRKPFKKTQYFDCRKVREIVNMLKYLYFSFQVRNSDYTIYLLLYEIQVMLKNFLENTLYDL